MLRQAEAGAPVEDFCRKLSVSEASFYRWKKQYGDGAAELRCLKQFEEEKKCLHLLVAAPSPDRKILRKLLTKMA